MDPALSLHTTVVSMSLLVTSCSKACHGPSPVSAYDSSLNEPVGDWL